MSCFNVPGDMALNGDETDCVFVQGIEAIKQQIRTGLQVFRNRWHYDRKAGIDYIEDVFEKNPDLRVIRAIFWLYIASVPGVIDVTDVNLKADPLTRTLFVTFAAVADEASFEDNVALVFLE